MSGSQVSVEQVLPGKVTRRRWKWVVWAVALWFLGDFAYSRYVAYRVNRWEANVPWTQAGLSPDAEERDWGQEDAEVALLMVHGFSDSPQIYRKMGPELAKRGYRVRAIRLPGFGEDLEAYQAYGCEEWLAEVEEEFELLAEKHDKVWIVGHSLGGALTIQHCLRTDPQTERQPDGIVLIAPAVAVSDARSPLLPTRFWHELSKYVLPCTQTTCSPFQMDIHDPAEKQRPYRCVFSPRSVVENTFQLLDDNRGHAADLGLPSLVFVATEDKIVDSAATEAFFEDIPSKSKKLIALADSGHVIPVDQEWQKVTEGIHDFIVSSDPATRPSPPQQ